MATLREFYESISNGLAQMWGSDAPMGPATPENRTIFVEGYRQALHDLKTTWQANELWNREVFCTDFLVHQGRIKADLEQRLGLVAASTEAMVAGGSAAPGPAGAGEIPPGGVREGSG